MSLICMIAGGMPFMNSELLSRLRKITDEEWDILNCHRGVQKALYTESPEFVVDSQKLLEKGQLIQIRTRCV